MVKFTPRFSLRVVECLFSLLVLGLTAGWINAFSTPNVNWALFVGLTSMLLCGALIAVTVIGKAEERNLLLLEFVLTAVYWVFWLAAAAATADTTHSWNSYYHFAGVDCATLAAVDLSYYSWGCEAYKRVPVLRAACAFCWLTWFVWCGSLYFCIKDDVLGKRIFSSTAAPAPSIAPTGTEAATKEEADAKV